MTGVALVTGGSRNLGRRIALQLAADGLHVVINARASEAQANAVAAEIRAAGGSAEAALGDVSNPAEVATLIERARAAGPLRVLVNNASLRSRIPVDELDETQWRTVMSVSLDGAWYCAQASLPALRAAGGGAIVNILGGNALAGDATRVHVSAAKHGLLGLTLGLAEALRPLAITVNGISPVAMTVDGTTTEAARARVAEAVAWLASPAARSVTGQILHVKGTG